MMDLKQASTGLHCAAASRVYIITPIWRKEVEAQAIKRAHRIGQTREVFVETLVLKGTIEERLWRRRRARSADEDAGVGVAADVSSNPDSADSIPQGKVTSAGTNIMTSGGWLEDQGVVDVIKNEGFLEIGEGQKGDGTEKAARLDGDGVQLFKHELELRRAFFAGAAGEELVLKKRRLDDGTNDVSILSRGKDKGKGKGRDRARVGFADAEPAPLAERSRVSFADSDTPRSSIFGGVALPLQQQQQQQQDSKSEQQSSQQAHVDGSMKIAPKLSLKVSAQAGDGVGRQGWEGSK